MECRVNEIKPLGMDKGAGNLVICEVLKMHVSEAVMTDNNTIDQEKLDLVARGGGSYYIRAREGFLEIPKPLRIVGIGVDMLPDSVRKSSILTGNDLGLLGNIEALPTKDYIEAFWKQPSQSLLKNELKTIEDRHHKAKELLKQKNVLHAWCVLLK
jgi:hypothetical protein